MRVLVFLFGVISYIFGVSALLAWISNMVGLVPYHAGPFEYGGVGASFVVAFLLTSLFTVQHSIMARPWFKRIVEKILPRAAERALYMFFTGLVLWTVLVLWPPNTTLVWNIESPIFANAVLTLGILGWVYLFVASFAINHFELFGLYQVYNYLLGKEPPQIPFRERLMYKFDRHPIMTGALIGMWATPSMQVDHLMFAGLFTVYIVIGVSFEERDLIRQWGEKYLGYKKRVKSTVPTVF